MIVESNLVHYPGNVVPPAVKQRSCFFQPDVTQEVIRGIACHSADFSEQLSATHVEFGLRCMPVEEFQYLLQQLILW